MDIREFVVKMLKGCGKKQCQIVEESGVEQNLVSRYSNGIFLPKLEHFLSLCKVCGFRVILHDTRDDLARAEYIADEVGADAKDVMRALADWEEGESYE